MGTSAKPKRYFDLSEDVYAAGRWQLGSPIDEHGQGVDPWQFTKGHPVQVQGRLRVPLEAKGKPLDFTLAGLDTPVVHVKVASILAELAPNDVQLLPVEVEGQPDQFSILVATRLIQCIDEKASEEVRHWRTEDGRPDKVGKYRVVAGMRIDPARAGNAQVFRTWGWSIALIVSEELKEALERLGATGARFKAV